MTLEMVNKWGDIREVVVKYCQPVERGQPLVSGKTAPFFSLINTLDAWQVWNLTLTPVGGVDQAESEYRAEQNA